MKRLLLLCMLGLAFRPCLKAQEIQADHPAPGVSAPVLIKSVNPKYPQPFFRKAHSGTATISLNVDEQGLPQDVHVRVSSGARDLDDSAVTAVRQYLFRPAMKDGHPVKVPLNVQVEFKLYY